MRKIKVITIFVFLVAFLASNLIADDIPVVEVKDNLEFPKATWGKNYVCKFVIKGEKVSKWFIKDEKQLPPGLSLNDNGYLTGTPDAKKVNRKENYNFVIVAQIKKKEGNVETMVSKEFNIILKFPKPKAKKEYQSSELLRLIAGYEFSHVLSDHKNDTKLFIDLFSYQPLTSFDPQKKTRLWGWENLRLTSMPIAGGRSVIKTAEVHSDMKLHEIAAAMEGSAGIEYTFLFAKWKKNINLTVSLLGGIGVASTISELEDEQSILEINDEFEKEFPGYDYEKKEYVAFVVPETKRFYMSYFGGLRFKTYGRDGARFPALLDAVIGVRNLKIEGQPDTRKRKFFRVDGFMPFRLLEKVPAYFFFTMVSYFDKTILKDRIYFKKAPDEVKIYDEGVIVISTPENHFDLKDYYRIGIGVDLLDFFKTDKKK